MSALQFPSVHRRRFLAGSATALGSAALLAACGPSGSGGGGGGGNGGTSAEAMPTYQKIDVEVEPDLVGDEVVQDVYFSYPNPPFTSVEHETGSGGDLRAMIITYNPPPTPLDKNSYWELMNSELGVNYIPEIVSSTDYEQKFSTVIAGGGDLPDIIQCPLWMSLPRMNALIDNQFEDLTEHLGGDAVLKYPNLANIPAYAWSQAISKGKLWGIPVTRTLFPSVMYIRTDISSDAGFDEAPKSQEEFLEWGKAMTDKSKQRYAFSAADGGWMTNTTNGMYEVPNAWQLDGETLTESFEHDSYFEGLDFVKKVWELGYMHPDTPGMSVAQQKTLFWQGRVAACEDGIAWYPDNINYPDTIMGGRAPWTKDGSKVHAMQGSGIFSVNALKRGLDPAKVEEILNIMDYLAAPFGSEEYTKIAFGIEGEQYTMVDGSPQPDTERSQDRAINLGYVSAAPQAQYASAPVLRDTFTGVHALQTDIATGLVPNPIQGLRSDTQEKNGQYTTAIEDDRNDYILGRKTLDELKATIKEYQDKVQAKIKEELLEALRERGDI